MLLLLATMLLGAAPERPAVLVFGTGWGAEGTQASIEAHVLALAQATQADRVLIGGGAQVRSVQAEAPVDETSALLGLVFDRREGLQVRYHQPSRAEAGAATKENVLASIKTLLGLGRGLVVFGAGHGSPASEDGPAALELWGPDDQLDVKALALQLDAAEGKGPIALVLGQCHSGAFANLMYVAGDPAQPLAEPTRCVLAAVPADREAAGCTADLDAPDARAYLGSIAEALAEGRADYDRDGRVSLDEAHTYALLGDSTVDVPVRSSEIFVEQRRRLPPLAKIRSGALGGALPLEQRALAGLLPEALKDQGPAQVAAALEQLRAEEKRLDDRAREARDQEDQLRQRVADRLLTEWPELTNPYHPVARQLLAGEAPAIRRGILADPELAALKARAAASVAAEEASLAVARRRARLERYGRLAQHIAARAQLKAPDRSRLARLYGCEATGL